MGFIETVDERSFREAGVFRCLDLFKQLIRPVACGSFFQIDRAEFFYSTHHFALCLLGNMKWQTLKSHS